MNRRLEREISKITFYPTYEERQEEQKKTGKLHEHPDCIRIAYEWLSAQYRIKVVHKRYLPLKHIIESWAGRYVSKDDVAVAAKVLGLEGEYPNYNISKRLVKPCRQRLKKIESAQTQNNYDEKYEIYKREEKFDPHPHD
jgi:hypothetical protein